MPNNSDTAERAREIALDVDGLYRGAPARWRDQWATAAAEAEDWYARDQEAERKQRDAEDDIWREVRAVEAGKDERRLTDPHADLGEGWTWKRVHRHTEISHPEKRLRIETVEAWLPPDAAIDPKNRWPRPAPSLAAHYLILAVFHDAVLPKGSAKIMDAQTAESRAVDFVERWNFDDEAPPSRLQELELWGEFRLRRSRAGLDRVKTYLNAVRADLARELVAHTEAHLKTLERREDDRRYGIIKALVLSVLLIVGFEWLVYGMPFDWLRNHTNSYALQAGVDGLIVSLMVGLFRPRWRKFWWVNVLVALVVLVISLLGGPSKVNSATYHMP